jgi:hypothetical protein
MATPMFAQEVKIKDRVASIDKVAFVKWDNSLRAGFACQVSHAKTDTPILSMKLYYYEKYNTAAKKYVRTGYYKVKFLDFDGEFQTTMLTKKFFKTLYKSGIINEDGTVDEEKAKKFIRTYDEDIRILDEVIIR